jgi:AcrR family transcriptional regulator
MTKDRRVIRTRNRLVEAFNHLVLQRRQRHIRVADIVDQSKVGRSTFYEHFSSAESLHMEALKRPLAPLADAAAGHGNEAAVSAIVAHFWEYRQRSQKSLSGPAERVLATMIEERLDQAPLTLPKRLAARQLASATLTPLVAWLKGEAPCTAEEMARSICRSGKALNKALTGEI